MPVAQLITVVNQSGKVVKTSKSLKGVWDEAKSAYDAKKSELLALRKAEKEGKEKERKALRELEGLTIEDDNVSRASSRRSSKSRRDAASHSKRKPIPTAKTVRPPMVERGYTDTFYDGDLHRSHRPSPLRHDSAASPRDDEPRAGELMRRHTTDLERRHARPRTAKRSASSDDIDMDLAYGDFHPPPLPERKYDTEIELRSKMSGLQQTLDELNCLQHSATAIIANLQKNPDAMAAVALTLGEISNLAMKLAPGALASMKGAFPAIIALLASPQFAIAIGVGVGVTVIAFGGYKIVKKIQGRKAEEAKMLEDGTVIDNGGEPESPASEMDELRELNSIEMWRRGIAEAEAESLGTSVDGEFITPVATRTLIEEGRLTEADLKSTVSSKKGDKKKKHRKDKEGSEAGSKVSSKSKSSSKTKAKKEKEPSGLKMLFKGHSKTLAYA